MNYHFYFPFTLIHSFSNIALFLSSSQCVPLHETPAARQPLPRSGCRPCNGRRRACQGGRASRYQLCRRLPCLMPGQKTLVRLDHLKSNRQSFSFFHRCNIARARVSTLELPLRAQLLMHTSAASHLIPRAQAVNSRDDSFQCCCHCCIFIQHLHPTSVRMSLLMFLILTPNTKSSCLPRWLLYRNCSVSHKQVQAKRLIEQQRCKIYIQPNICLSMSVIIVQFACFVHSMPELHIVMVVAVNFARACFHPNKMSQQHSVLCCALSSACCGKTVSVRRSVIRLLFLNQLLLFL